MNTHTIFISILIYCVHKMYCILIIFDFNLLLYDKKCRNKKLNYFFLVQCVLNYPVDIIFTLHKFNILIEVFLFMNVCFCVLLKFYRKQFPS